MTSLGTPCGEVGKDRLGAFESTFNLVIHTGLSEYFDAEDETSRKNEGSIALVLVLEGAKRRKCGREDLLHDAHLASKQASLKCLGTYLRQI